MMTLEFGIPPNTLTIYKNRDKVLKNRSLYNSGVIKRVKSVKYPDIEKSVLEWFKNSRDQNLPISGPIFYVKKPSDYAL